MNKRITLGNTELRQYIQLLESNGVTSKELMERFFNLCFGIDKETFNEQYRMTVRITLDNMKRMLETENDNNDVDINDLAKDEEKREKFVLRDGDDDEIWK